MLTLLLYYLVLPILSGLLVIKLIKASGALEPPGHFKRLYEAHPIESRMFRAARVDGEKGERRATLIGDFETLSEAVDAIYAAREKAQQAEPGVRIAFIALNDKMEMLEEVDS